MSLVLIIFSIIISLIYILYLISGRKYDYWKKQNVPHLKPAPFVGNYGDYILLKRYIGYVVQDICKAFPDAPYIGTYYGPGPALIIQDPELIKLITTKDFYYFNSRDIMEHTHREPIGQILFFTYGDRWRVMRQNLSPLFSSGKMKNMFQLIYKCAHKFERILDEETRIKNVIEAKNFMVNYTTDCIGTCAFGVDINFMEENKENPFKVIAQKLFVLSYLRGIAIVARSTWPSIFYGLGLQALPDVIMDFFHKFATQVFKERNNEPSPRNDFIDLLLNLKKEKYVTGDSLTNMKTNTNKKIKLKVDDEFMALQCVQFFGAGLETSSSAMSFTLYELAKNEEAQIRVFEEIDEYLHKHDNKIYYECVNELPYLTACIDEALRLYPLFGVLTREVVEDYTLPSGVHLEKGIRIHLPVYHMHHNPDNFPDPEEYRPERMLPKEKRNIKSFTYLPFGEGPRICIGMRFAYMKMLPGLITILKKYRLELAEGMPRSLDLEPKVTTILAKGNLNLKLVPRDGWEQRVYAC